MSVKAVYASKTLAIYITDIDVDELLRGNIVLGPVIAADETIAAEGIDVRMTVPGIKALCMVRGHEKLAYKPAYKEAWEEHVKRISKEMFG